MTNFDMFEYIRNDPAYKCKITDARWQGLWIGFTFGMFVGVLICCVFV